MKLMSSLWKMAAHWKGAPVVHVSNSIQKAIGDGGKIFTVDFLASSAMAVLCVERLLTAQLVSDLPAVTAALVADLEVGIVALDFVGGTEFPLVKLALGAAIVAVVAVGAVALCISHLGKGGMELGLQLGETGERTERGGGGCYGVYFGASELQVETEETGCYRHAVLVGCQWVVCWRKV